MCAILGALGAFLMARDIRPDTKLALLIAFLFSTAPRFVSSLEWQMPTRSLFTALVPLFVWALLRLRARMDPVSLGVLGTSLLLMMSAHRLAVVMAIVMAAYIVANIFIVSVRILRTTYAPVFLHRRFRAVLRLGSWCVIVITVVYIMLFSGVLGEYEQGQLVGGSNPIAQLENLGISLARTVGLLLPLVIVGVLAFGYLQPGDVRPRLIPIGSLTIEDDSLFVLDGVNFEVIWSEILSRPVNDPYVAEHLSLYNIQYYLEDRGLPGSFEAYGHTYASPFAASVASDRYVVYESGSVALYFLQSSGT